MYNFLKTEQRRITTTYQNNRKNSIDKMNKLSKKD